MRKINQIDCCGHCPLMHGFFCTHIETEGMPVNDDEYLPNWCPLPEDV